MATPAAQSELGRKAIDFDLQGVDGRRYRLELRAGAKRELFDAMRQIVSTGKGPAEQIPNMGCSIKWRG